MGSNPGSRRSHEAGNSNILTTAVFLPGEFHEQSHLVDYSPWGHRESDTAKHLSAQHTIKYKPKHKLKVINQPCRTNTDILRKKTVFNKKLVNKKQKM